VVTAQLAEEPRASDLRPADRMAVAALCSVLPAHFRPRQRAEWTADLLILARQGGAARLRYLLGAAWTLPTLRAVARRGPADGPRHALRVASPSVVLASRVLTISLAWTVLSWLVMVPGRYVLLDVPGRLARGSAEIWPDGDQPWYVVPLVVILYWGSLGAVYDFPLVPAAVIVASVLVLLERREPWQERVRRAILRIGVIAVSGAALTLVSLLATTLTTGSGGPLLGAIGLGAVGLGAVGRGLSRRNRIVLAVLGVATIAMVVVNHTVGLPMVVWFQD